MNKQEAIEKIKDLYSFDVEDGPFEVGLINKNQVLDIISQIDEPQVEQEKLYTVELPNPNLKVHTILQKVGEGLALIMVTDARWKEWESSKLTEAEIKQDFDFLWQFAKEVETDE